MKTNIIIFCCWLLLLGASSAFGDRAKFHRLGTSGNVSVSTSSWTAVPSTSSVDASRLGVMIDSYDTNSANMLIQFTTSTTISKSTSTGITLKPADEPWTLEFSRDIYIWAISLHTSAENIFEKELLGPAD